MRTLHKKNQIVLRISVIIATPHRSSTPKSFVPHQLFRVVNSVSVCLAENVTFLENIFHKAIFWENNNIFRCSIET